MTRDFQLLVVSRPLVRFVTVVGAGTFQAGYVGQVLRLPRPPSPVESTISPGEFISSSDPAPRFIRLERVFGADNPFVVYAYRAYPQQPQQWTLRVDEWVGSAQVFIAQVVANSVNQNLIASGQNRTHGMIANLVPGGVWLSIDGSAAVGTGIFFPEGGAPVLLPEDWIRRPLNVIAAQAGSTGVVRLYWSR